MPPINAAYNNMIKVNLQNGDIKASEKIMKQMKNKNIKTR